ncbi:MAG: cobalamin biosynthesis protein, partial [Synergistaceae bacterium]|nr:cobalamin biosynthesis protein [Synergistaceae bacterium]
LGNGNKKDIMRGALTVVIVAAISTFVPAVLLFLIWKIHPIAYFILDCIMCWQIVAARQLARESGRVEKALKNGDVEAARKTLNKHLKINYYWGKREWPYKNVKPRIIAEKYIDSLGKPESIEYKLTCFNGVAKLITICKGIAHTDFDKRTNDHYDRDLNPLKWYAYYKNSPVPVQPPKEIHEIIALSEKLAAGIPQVRVDSYLIDNKIYFGEMTFYTWAGFIRFNPPEWDEILGSWIELPKLK